MTLYLSAIQNCYKLISVKVDIDFLTPSNINKGRALSTTATGIGNGY